MKRSSLFAMKIYEITQLLQLLQISQHFRILRQLPQLFQFLKNTQPLQLPPSSFLNFFELNSGFLHFSLRLTSAA